MLKQLYLILQIMNQNAVPLIDHYQKEKKNEKVIGLMKDELGRKILSKFVELRAKTYIYLLSEGREDKKGKDTKKCVIKRKFKFENYKSCLEATQFKNK